MRTDFDFSPLFRSTVGFDRMFDLLQSNTRADEGWPPYDIERLGDDAYRVTLALAGFRPDELNVVAQQNLLIVSGDRRNRAEDNRNDGGEQGRQRQVLHRGIAGRAFERRFELADHVKVVGAGLADGLLTIELRREVPEAMRPRRIEISGTAGSDNVLRGPQPQRQVEGQQAA